MNLPFSEYLSPTNPYAFAILIALVILFVIWGIGLIISWVWLWARKRQISKNEDVQFLVDARQKRGSGRDEHQRKVLAETTFSEFCEEQSFSENTAVAKHLKAIFLSGWTESHLEVGELINHTTSNIFRWNNLLRSVLAVFIVIGLFGTLFGLTDSLTQLSTAWQASAIDQTSAGDSENMTQALRGLLDDMKGAFAPSILGIFFTILGIIVYNVYLQFACQPVKSTLEQLTLTIWIPQLYPTASQQLTQSGYQTASQVSELVATVKSNITDLESNISNFDQSLNRADEVTQPLSHSVSQINTAADVLNEAFAERLHEFLPQFTEKVTHLTSFQVEIQNLYQQLKDESDTFQHGANQRLDKQTQTLDEQTQNLIKTLSALKNYEEIYIASWKQISETFEQFLNKATETNNSINTTNTQFLEKINATTDEMLEQFLNKATETNTSINTTNTQFIEDIKATNRQTLEQFRNIFTDITETNTKINTTNIEFIEDIKATNRQTLEQFRNIFTEINISINATNTQFLEKINATTDEMLEEFLNKTTETNNSINTTNTQFIEDIKATNRQTLEQFRNIFTDINTSINTTNTQFLEKINATTDEMLEEFLNKATETNDSINATNIEFLEKINTTNRAWIDEIQNQLRTELAVLQPTLEMELRTLTDGLTTNLKEVQETLDEKLEDLTKQLQFFQLPIEKAADQIEGIIETFVRFMRATIGDLQVEMKKQNENYGAQLEAVKDLNRQIMGRLDKLNESSENQSNAVNALSSTVGSLGEDTNLLTDAIYTFTSDSGALSKSIGSIEGHAKRLGDAADDLVKKADVTTLNANIGKLGDSIGEIAQHSQTLATSAERLAEQSSSSNGSPSDEIRKPFFLKRIWNSLLRKK